MSDKSIKRNTELTGKQQQRALVENTVKNSTFFPSGVHLEDLDTSFVKNIKENFQIEVNGEKVPIIPILTLKKFTEFMKTWQVTDEFRTPQLPIMTIQREYIAERGTNLGNSFNVPSSPTFNLFKRPIMKNGRMSVEYYQIPQPVNVDLHYKLTFFTNKLRDVNKLNELVLHAFKESQYYITVNGHHMPMKLEGIDDMSQTKEIDKRRYFEQVYNMVLKGYLLREEDFKKLRSVDKISIDTDSCVVKESRDCSVDVVSQDCEWCYKFKFTRRSPKSGSVKINKTIDFSYDNQSQNNNILYFINGTEVNLPFRANAGDKLTVAHDIEVKKPLLIKVCGEKI